MTNLILLISKLIKGLNNLNQLANLVRVSTTFHLLILSGRVGYFFFTYSHISIFEILFLGILMLFFIAQVVWKVLPHNSKIHNEVCFIENILHMIMNGYIVYHNVFFTNDWNLTSNPSFITLIENANWCHLVVELSVYWGLEKLIKVMDFFTDK